MMSEARVHVLRFSDPSALQRAFADLNGHRDVESCVVESEACQIRFVAASDACDALLERFYVEGGLVWCTRHDFHGG